MILKITHADYVEGYTLKLSFNNGETLLVDLKGTLDNETRKIFSPLKELDYFKDFRIMLNTITWENEADFAPEYLFELGQKQKEMARA